MNATSPSCSSASRAVAYRKPAPTGTLDDARAFMESHFNEALSVPQLAEMCALSVSRFATAFRQRFGEAPHRYLCSVRVAAAQRLLLAGVPGSHVATDVGFFDQSHLARHFKRLCGETPSEFVQRHRTHERHRPRVRWADTSLPLG
ncbi:AraC family transcriptional regulator [Pandoraea cepalis]|uniref:AraC family transcriptional regulator n=3 Tax=Burkholderiaceae TaxID=119060 RepID=A0AAW7MKD7_9BURK|nr:AraC family transcriptional regulator [Pandoraea cepalis]MDN4577546.1 AraC family transcriptional regulator [Pandoraea cepalis]VVE10087.1 AraC family transcriptional regulator [Pandoraea soli]